jgi:hypothetical protein
VSYDLTLFRVPEGANPASVHQQILAEDARNAADIKAWMARPLPETVRADMRRIADLIKGWRPSLEEFQPAMPLPWIELNDPELPVQFSVHPTTVGITIPYGGDGAREMLECAISCCEMLRDAGYFTFDPQLDRLVTRADIVAMLGIHMDVEHKFPEILASLPEPKKPWWKFW